ncbi:uracil-DNA glycosylase [Beggiatoa alba]|nr:uracil-DNA glycosylase [Beggiatoa alba]
MTTRQQQSAYLQAMGIQAWVSRTEARDEASAEIQAVEISAEVPVAEVLPDKVLAATVAKVKLLPVVSDGLVSDDPVSDGPPMPTDDYMPSLDISESTTDLASAATPEINVSNLDWPELQSTVSACTACALHQSRTQAVFGVGNHGADWMIVGEAPKADEDQQGTPFVGDSGQLLNNMLRALGLTREQVFITNILKCRPADDRDPRPEELSQCDVYLQRQIALLAPKVILAVGGVAAHSLLKLKTPVTKLRGQLHHYDKTPVVVTYHPAYLLRKPREKAKCWEDLRFAASVVSGNIGRETP